MRAAGAMPTGPPSEARPPGAGDQPGDGGAVVVARSGLLAGDEPRGQGDRRLPGDAGVDDRDGDTRAGLTRSRLSRASASSTPIACRGALAASVVQPVPSGSAWIWEQSIGPSSGPGPAYAAAGATTREDAATSNASGSLTGLSLGRRLAVGGVLGLARPIGGRAERRVGRQRDAVVEQVGPSSGTTGASSAS